MDIRKAALSDGKAIFDLTSLYAECGVLLPRTLEDIYRRIREFSVCTDDGKMIGCGSLQVVWEGLAEIKSLAVEKAQWRKGMGSAIVGACVAEAKSMDIPEVFVLTYETEFFGGLGFNPVDKATLPHKIWSDCVLCPRFPDCDEEAMKLHVGDASE